MTEIKELERKHLCSYLPYGLKWYHSNRKGSHLITLYNANTIISAVNNQNYKIALRPMSDLYKERGGKIDIVELAKVACKICKVEFEPDFTTIKHNEGHSIVVRCKKWESEFWYHFDGYFYFEYNGDIMDFPQLDLFNYLFEHHFDVYGLIDKGLAIDINTIE